MKITGIKVRQVEVPLVEPFRISLGVITHSRSVIVSVETDEGLVGYGEGAPAILITGESLSGTNDVIKAMEREHWCRSDGSGKGILDDGSCCSAFGMCQECYRYGML